MFGRRELEEEIENLKEKKESLEAQNWEYINDILDLKKRNENLKQELDEVKSQQRLNDLEDELKNKTTKLEKKEEELNKLSRKLEISKNQNEHLEQELSTKDKEIQAYIQAINNVSITFQKCGIEKQQEKKQVEPKKENK